MKVLFLSAWYPTERDAMAGLFVQKHAEAVKRQGVDVEVLYTEAKGIHWYLEMWKMWCKLKRDWGMPDIVQMNVLDKNGLLAWWLKRRYRIPYIIVEHWSGYLPTNFSFRGGWHGWLMRKIAKNASCILPVSKILEDAMKNCGIENAHWQRIHNVVDDFFYQPISKITVPAKSKDKFRLLHVSCFDEKAKNIQGMLRAVRKVAEQRQDFELIIVGTGIDYSEDYAYATSLGFPEGILTFTGEQTPHEVAQWMQQSDAFVMFSRYETFAIVLAEAMAVGIPIVSSNTAGIAMDMHKDCGIVIPSEDENALTVSLLDMIDNHSQFSTDTIRKYGNTYTFKQVGKTFLEIYQEILQGCT